MESRGLSKCTLRICRSDVFGENYWAGEAHRLSAPQSALYIVLRNKPLAAAAASKTCSRNNFAHTDQPDKSSVEMESAAGSPNVRSVFVDPMRLAKVIGLARRADCQLREVPLT